MLLDDGSTIDVDAVVLTLGHLDADPSGEHGDAAKFADAHGLTYLPPTYGADVDLTVFGAGDDVIVRGFGLAFIDLCVLMTEGRGGRFFPADGGGLRYVRSGREPRFFVGSRRGVPYRCKPTPRLLGTRPNGPRFFDRAGVDELLDAHEEPGSLDFMVHVWPLLAKEMAWGYYHELCTGHPERVTIAWSELDAALAAHTWGDPELDARIEQAVPALEDRLDLPTLDRPLDGVSFITTSALQQHLRAHIRADVDRRTDPDSTFSADQGALLALLSTFDQLPRVLASPKLEGRSRLAGFDDWFFGFFSYYASGPPPRRLEELIALSEAGVVQFLGADISVELDHEAGVYRASSPSSPQVVEATALIDARLPGPTIRGSQDPLVRALDQRGELRELVLRDADGVKLPTGMIRVDHTARLAPGRTADGQDHPARLRYALGPHSTSRAPAFARPNTNGAVFRSNDATARAILIELRALTDSPARPAPNAAGGTEDVLLTVGAADEEGT